MDAIGFTHYAHFSVFDSKTTAFVAGYHALTYDFPAGLYPIFNEEPRFMADFNGDGFSDIIGFDSTEIKV